MIVRYARASLLISALGYAVACEAICTEGQWSCSDDKTIAYRCNGRDFVDAFPCEDCATLTLDQRPPQQPTPISPSLGVNCGRRLAGTLFEPSRQAIFAAPDDACQDHYGCTFDRTKVLVCTKGTWHVLALCQMPDLCGVYYYQELVGPPRNFIEHIGTSCR